MQMQKAWISQAALRLSLSGGAYSPGNLDSLVLPLRAPDSNGGWLQSPPHTSEATVSIPYQRIFFRVLKRSNAIFWQVQLSMLKRASAINANLQITDDKFIITWGSVASTYLLKVLQPAFPSPRKCIAYTVELTTQATSQDQGKSLDTLNYIHTHLYKPHWHGNVAFGLNLQPKSHFRSLRRAVGKARVQVSWLNPREAATLRNLPGGTHQVWLTAQRTQSS